MHQVHYPKFDADLVQVRKECVCSPAILFPQTQAAKELLIQYYKTTGLKPQRLIMYRDGVSEGQFQAVLSHEYVALRQVRDPEPSPEITHWIRATQSRLLPSLQLVEGKRDVCKKGEGGRYVLVVQACSSAAKQ